MTEAHTEVHTVVLDGGTARVEVGRAAVPRLLEVAVTVDGDETRSSVAGWRDLSYGSGDGTAYAWSAREVLVLLPRPGEVLQVDDDLVVVFRDRGRWLLVCETSIRVLQDARTVARVELADAVVTAAWDGDLLRLELGDGSRSILRTPPDGALVVDPGSRDVAGEAADRALGTTASLTPAAVPAPGGTVRAELRRVHSPDVVDLVRWQPDGPVFAVLLQLMVGPAGGPGEESFDVLVRSVEHARAQVGQDGALWTQHTLLVEEWAWPALLERLRRRVSAASGPSWEDVARRLAAWTRWELEDYRD